jgi:hypothetical protein
MTKVFAAIALGAASLGLVVRPAGADVGAGQPTPEASSATHGSC